MSVRIAFAAALRLLRTGRGLKQDDLSGSLTQSHVSQIENGKTSPSLEVIIELSDALKLHPVALMALVCAAQEKLTASDVLEIAEKIFSRSLYSRSQLPWKKRKDPILVLRQQL